MDFPANDSFHQVFHQPNAGDPGPIDGLLIMDHVRTGFKREGSSLPDQSDFPPFPRRLNSRQTTFVVAAGVKGSLDTLSASQVRISSTLSGPDLRT